MMMMRKEPTQHMTEEDMAAEVDRLRRQVAGLWVIINAARQTITALHAAYQQAMTAIAAAVSADAQRHIARTMRTLEDRIAALEARAKAAEAELAPPPS